MSKMRIISLAALLWVGAMGKGVMAEDTGRALGLLGSDICLQSLAGNFAGHDASDFAQALEAAGADRTRFCGCVSARYKEEGDAELLADLRAEIAANQDHFILNFTLFDHMSHCLPEGVQVGLGVDLGMPDDLLEASLLDAGDGEVIDGDLVDLDERDIDMCRTAFAGDLDLPGFKPLAAKLKIKATASSVEDVCSCAAFHIAALGEAFQTELEAAQNPSVVYGSALAGGIAQCLNG